MSNLSLADVGAVNDGKTLNTAAIQEAIDKCHAGGGGIVSCPAGTYLTGSFDLKSNVELHLERGCKILGSPDVEDYRDLESSGLKNENAPEKTTLYLVGASHAENIAITGPGEINANGLTFYTEKALGKHGKFEERPHLRPRAVMLHKCKNVRIIDSSFIDSPCWTFWLMMCERVQIQRITIEGDFRMHNNDGIDIDACRNVTISDCNIKTDDDCLILRSIQSMYEEEAICENITVSNCNLSSTCQGIRIGCPTDNIIRNATFSNLTITSTKNGINSEFPARYVVEGCDTRASVSDIMFSDCIINCEWHPIRIKVTDDIELQKLSSFSFSNMRINCGRPLLVNGDSKTVIEDVSFNNIDIKFKSDNAFDISKCSGVRFNNVTVSQV
ncbi:MAG: glycoside hydrolase family 28 protein [Planctomycetota bacterium]|jgi:polygalacturonase